MRDLMFVLMNILLNVIYKKNNQSMNKKNKKFGKK